MNSELQTALPAPPPAPGEGRAELQLGLEQGWDSLWPCAQARSQAGEQQHQRPLGGARRDYGSQKAGIPGAKIRSS